MPLRGRKECMPRDSGARMSGVAMYQGRALADISLSGVQLAEALELFISRRDPSLENVLIRRATPTGDVETRVQPHKRWYEVLFEVDETLMKKKTMTTTPSRHGKRRRPRRRQRKKHE